MSVEDDIILDTGDFPTEELETFESAAAHIRAVAGSVLQDDLLFLYGRFKFGTEGPCDTPRPGFFDFQGRKKWEAWNGVSCSTKEEAREEYVRKVEGMNCGWNSKENAKDVKGDR